MPSTLLRPYQTALQSIAAVWLIVAVIAVAANSAAEYFVGGERPPTTPPLLASGDLLLIAGVSGLIAIAATVPGLLIVIPQNTVASSSDSSEKPTEKVVSSPHAIAVMQVGQAFLAGILIRITGTVALFLASRYYMDAPPIQIGIWVLGWHVVLLWTEVIALARQIPVS